MAKYVFKRCLTGIGTIFILITVTFFLTRLMPGNPFQSENVSEQVLASMEEEYGLNQPVLMQYGTYLSNLLQGDLGISFKKPGVTVNEVLGRAVPITFSIGIPALALSAGLGILLGISQAKAKQKWVRHFILAGTTAGVGVPNFVAALILSLVFGVWLEWLPIVGLTSAAHYVLPVISLSLYPLAMITRYMSQSFEKELFSDYVLLAKAKGLPEGKIAVKHILKIALVPVLTAMGPIMAFLLTGSFVVESIFTIPGLGREFVNAIANRDYTLIMGLTIFMGTAVILISLVMDLVMMFLDPLVSQSSLEMQ